MKKIFVITLVALISFVTIDLQAKNLWAFLTYATFNSPEGPYIETYLSVAGNTVKFIKKDNGKFQATVNILMTFKQNNDIKAFKKYELFSPEIGDTLKTDFNFVDQQRFSLPNGSYDFEIQLSDQNNPAQPVPYNQSLTVDFPSDKPVFSDIELVKSYTQSLSVNDLAKSGFDLIPYTYTFYSQNESKLIFYAELYNMEKTLGKEQKFLLSWYIESFENNIRLHEYSKAKKEITKEVNVFLSEINIDNLASGNYNLVLEARDQQNALVASKKIFFQRMNPKAQMTLSEIQATNIANTFAEKIMNADTLKEYISCTYPIATGIEKVFIRTSLKTSDLKTRQQFLYNFWVSRDANDPEKAWLAYKDQVYKVQINFGTPVKKGYQTDRGRVYLEYGPPNTRSTQYNEPSNYPYEIWQYYTLNNGQRNKKFVFYSPDMVTSDFILLHSDAIGEVNNPRWKIDLRSRIYSTRDMQDTQVIKAWGDFEEDYWDLPN
ncbi:MAG: GWxTD domain-containing protein [Bacteroidales bacterium]|nr:GWxTD domain-containing protein [Bacteroidales bacterium]